MTQPVIDPCAFHCPFDYRVANFPLGQQQGDGCSAIFSCFLKVCPGPQSLVSDTWPGQGISIVYATYHIKMNPLVVALRFQTYTCCLSHRIAQLRYDARKPIVQYI